MADGWELRKPGVWRRRVGGCMAEVSGGQALGKPGEWRWCVTRGRVRFEHGERYRVPAGSHDTAPTRAIAMALADACLEVLGG